MPPFQTFASAALLQEDLSRLGHACSSCTLLRPAPLAAALHHLARLLPCPAPEPGALVPFWAALGVPLPPVTLPDEPAARRAHAAAAARALRAAVDVVCGCRLLEQAGGDERWDEDECRSRSRVVTELYRMFPRAVPEVAESRLRPAKRGAGAGRARREPVRDPLAPVNDGGVVGGKRSSRDAFVKMRTESGSPRGRSAVEEVEVLGESEVEEAHAELLDVSYLGDGFATRSEIDELVMEMRSALCAAEVHRETCESAVAMRGRVKRAERDLEAENSLADVVEGATEELGRVVDALERVRRVQEAYAVVKVGDAELGQAESVAKRVKLVARRVEGYRRTLVRGLKPSRHVPARKA